MTLEINTGNKPPAQISRDGYEELAGALDVMDNGSWIDFPVADRNEASRNISFARRYTTEHWNSHRIKTRVMKTDEGFHVYVRKQAL